MNNVRFLPFNSLGHSLSRSLLHHDHCVHYEQLHVPVGILSQEHFGTLWYKTQTNIRFADSMCLDMCSAWSALCANFQLMQKARKCAKQTKNDWSGAATASTHTHPNPIAIEIARTIARNRFCCIVSFLLDARFYFLWHIR